MKLSDVNYDSIDKLMRRLAKDHDITPRELHDRFKTKHKMIPDDWANKKMKINEEGLRDWFGKSKSKDGKSGWVQSDGSPCANEPGETKTPKCYSSAKKASMSKKELRSADARKSRQDPGQQQKSGASKPTYVSTDPKKKMKEETFNEAEDKKGSGSGTKDACYHKVKSRYSVWPSAYASGALVKCRKKGAANWGNSTKKEGMEEFYNLPELTESQIGALKYAGYDVEVVDEACWKGYEKKGMKTMFGKRYPNCVKKEEVEVDESMMAGPRKDAMKKKEYSAKSGSDRAIAFNIGTRRDVSNTDPKIKSRGGRSDKRTGEGDRGMGNAAKRRMGEEVTGGILIQDKEDFKPREIESVDIITPEPMKGMDEAVRTKPQTGNMYQVIFGWRGKMMMVKLFFPELKVPSRQEVASALEKMYPGSQLRSYSVSVVDYDDPYINVGEETDYNDEVQSRMKSDKLRRRTQSRNKMRASRYKQNKNLPANQNENYSNWRTDLEEDMTGMSQKSGDKRSTDSGAGMTAKGVAKYNRRTGGNLKTAVTTPPSKLKPGSKAAGRRKSFCARSKSWTGERGKAARRRWNC